MLKFQARATMSSFSCCDVYWAALFMVPVYPTFLYTASSLAFFLVVFVINMPVKYVLFAFHILSF